MALTIDKFKVGDIRMRSREVLVEATVQGVKIRGTVTCYTANEVSAKRLACMTFINHLRKIGVWTHIDEIDEPYKVEVDGPKDKKTGKLTKKEEIKYKKVTRYHAPSWDHVKAIEIIDDPRNFTFPMEELEEAARFNTCTTMPKPKRRTSGEVALKQRTKNQAIIVKKEKQLEKKKKVEANKQSKDERLRVVESHFTANGAKVIKVAAGELNQTYQRVRYALFQIKDKGYNGVKYNLIQTEIDGNKAFQLVKGKE